MWWPPYHAVRESITSELVGPCPLGCGRDSHHLGIGLPKNLPLLLIVTGALSSGLPSPGPAGHRRKSGSRCSGLDLGRLGVYRFPTWVSSCLVLYLFLSGPPPLSPWWGSSTRGGFAPGHLSVGRPWHTLLQEVRFFPPLLAITFKQQRWLKNKSDSLVKKRLLCHQTYMNICLA